ncbi:hypothetical protein Q8A67_001313 [Cirrhinus molitorella]|uniref:Cathepsin S n=1 Tax=Cirrhinus molitorella TaxID=172907 RepID=A0AA88QR42_9TELE|nr:hypothetical protein Q8A67_001313 [Cirrhinus molitorella]
MWCSGLPSSFSTCASSLESKDDLGLDSARVEEQAMMLRSLLFAMCCSTALAYFNTSLDQDWDLWKKKYHKIYTSEDEELGRREIWERNLEHVTIHNMEASKGLHSYNLSMNHLSDMTTEEILKTLATTRVPPGFKTQASEFLASPGAAVPDTVDWTKEGYVTSVKQQGVCGCCWAFSSVGALEGLLMKTTGQLVNLSTQNLMDCSFSYGNKGCKGGWPHYAFKYVIANGGIDSESSYPYEGVEGQCRYSPSHRAANCTNYYFVTGGDEEALKQAVANFGPISVAVDATNMALYSRGVYNDPSCNNDVNHAVLVVGYGVDSVTGLKYWLVKNSWGTDFGEDGYIRMARNKNNMCSIASYASFPVAGHKRPSHDRAPLRAGGWSSARERATGARDHRVTVAARALVSSQNDGGRTLLMNLSEQ